MDEIVENLKSCKSRIIRINHSDRNKYAYVKRCLEDISQISEFHYKNKDSDFVFYYGAVIADERIYICVDCTKQKIVLHNFESNKTLIVPQCEHEAVKEVISKRSKSAAYFLDRNQQINKMHKWIWFFLIGICLSLLCLYIANKFFNNGRFILISQCDDARFAMISLYVVTILAIQDSINIMMLRFERKIYDIWIIILGLFELIFIAMAILLLFIPGNFQSLAVAINILSIAITLGSIFFKFDKPRN